MFQTGTRLGEFEIIERLGVGGMGAVYKARQVSLKRLVALKTLQESLASDPEFVERFHREAIAAASLNHPNLVQVYSAGENEGLHWFAMEFVAGESAKGRLVRKGQLDLAEAIAIATHIATALEYGWRKAHLIHRDIKPDNIFLSTDGEVKLGDLGLAKSIGGAADTQGLTMTGSSMGTPYYISPEQGQGKKDVDFRADIYSLGCTFYHLASGEPPYPGDTPLAVMMQHVSTSVPNLHDKVPACPQSLAAAVLKMMAKDPAHRQQTYAEVLADLRRAYDDIAGASVPNIVRVTLPPQPAAQDTPTILSADLAAPIAMAGAASAAGDARSGVRSPAEREAAAKVGRSRFLTSLLPRLAAVGLILAIVAFFAFRKREPQLTEAERAAKVLRGAAAPDPSASPAAEGKEPPENPVAATATPAAETKDAPFENSLHMKFVRVPITGGPTNGQRVLFSIWDTRVQDYQIFAKETKREWSKPLFQQGPTHPAVNVSWEDAQAFCKWLTDRERKAGLLGARERYRLPSDHEWSCAVGIGDREDAALLPEEKKGRIDGFFPWGNQWPPPDKAANIASEELRPILEAEKIVVDDGLFHGVIQNYHDGYAYTSPVESFAPNALGLYDMGGNVQQWCEDWNDKNQKRRALRGASFATQERPFLLSSNRPFAASTGRYHWRGFRVVLASLPARPTAAAASPAVLAPPKEAPFVNTLGMKFVPVPIGGGPSKGQRVLFSVWDVRVQDYAEYAKAQESAGKKVDGLWKTQNKDGVPVGRELDHPVVSVNWEDAQAFCQWLTEKETAEGKLPKGLKYRLPSDEEWSWAVGLPPEIGATPAEKSGKNSVDFPWGKDWPPTEKVVNYADETFHAKFPKDAKNQGKDPPWIKDYTDGYATTSPVGSFPANAYGLYDMGGNVWQWCEDWFDKDQKDRVLRGASWTTSVQRNLLSSNRHQDPPGHRNFGYNGFRCVVSESAR